MPIRIPTRKRVSLLALTALWAGPIAAWSGQLELLTKVPPRLASITASGKSGSPALSADGRYLAFVSGAPNLAPGQIDDNSKDDVFLHDRITGAVTLVSHTAGSTVTAGDRDSGSPSISADGRWVAFESSSTDLVDGQIGAGRNVFLYDRLQGTLKLVSHSRRSPRISGNSASSHPALSADGRYVAFESYARDLINSPAGDPRANVFLYDRSTDKTVLVSHKAGSATADAQHGGDSPSVSADGRYVAFRSFSADLVPGQIEPYTFSRDVFVFDRSSGATLLASHAADSSITAAGGDGPMISADGGDVVFASSARNLVAGQTGEGSDNLFEFHRSTGIVTLVSHASASPTQTTRGIYRYAVGADGGWVAFSSGADDLVPGQVLWGDSFSADVFLWERASGAVRLVSHAFGLPATEALGESVLGNISADGQRVLFTSEARNLVGAESIETGGKFNVYLYDRSSDVSTLASYAGNGDTGGNDRSDTGVLSADGGWAAFPSDATDLARGTRDLNGAPDLFLFGRITGELELVSRRDPGLPSRTPPAWSTAGDLSSDGRYAVFDSNSAALVPGVRDTNGAGDVFLYDRTLKKTTLVSRSAASPRQAANADSRYPVLSADGRYVLYQSEATDLVSGQVDETPGGSAVYRDLFLYDQVAGTTTLVSRSPDSAVAATNDVEYGMISADGSIVAFVSEARDLVPDQGYKQHPHDVFVYDRASGTVTLVSHRDGSSSMPGNDFSDLTALSADGRFLAVSSFASDLLPGIQLPDDLSTGVLYLYDRVQGKPVLVSHAAGSPNRALGGFSGTLSVDGRFLAFESYDGGLVPGDGGIGTGTLDVYLYDRTGGATRLVSHAPRSPSTPSGALEGLPVLSADGRFVAYSGGYAVLSPSSSHHSNIHLFDRISGQTELISQSPRREEGSGDSSRPSISADGRYVAFLSHATNLTADPVTASPSSGNVSNNVYLYDRMAKKMTLVSRSFLPPFGGGNGVDSGVSQSLEPGPVALSGGGFVLFSTVASNLVPGDFNGAEADVFLYSPAP